MDIAATVVLSRLNSEGRRCTHVDCAEPVRERLIETYDVFMALAHPWRD